jgi:hypothetical protein
MRLSIVFAVAAASVTIASALPTPAAATDIDEAIKLCGQNRSCGIINTGKDGPGDGVDLQIVQSDGTVNIVDCPPRGKGPCQVVARPNNGGGRPVAVKGANPVNVISGTPPKTGTAGGKTQPVATTGKAGTTAPAKTVKRDHRGDTTKYVKPAKFAGTKDGHDPGWGNYEPKKGTGDVTVRDHRH